MRTSALNAKTEELIMKLNIYSIFDTATGLYSRPYFTQSDAEAMRAFEDLAIDAKHPVGSHPEDYSLFRLGTFDDNHGKMTNEENECLVTALETISKTRRVDKDQMDLLSLVKTTDGKLDFSDVPENLVHKLGVSR